MNNRYDYTRPNANITDRMIAIDQGMKITNNQWNFPVLPLNSTVVTAVTGSVGGFASGAANAYANAYIHSYNTSTDPDPVSRADTALGAAQAAAAAYVLANGGPPTGAMGTAADSAWVALGAAAGNNATTIDAVAAAVAANAGMSLDAALAYATAYAATRAGGGNASAAGNAAVVDYAINEADNAVNAALADPVLNNVRSAVALALPGISADEARIYATAYAFNGGDAAKAAEAAGLSTADARTAAAAADRAAATANTNTALPTAAMIGANKFAVNGTGTFGERLPNSTTNFGTNSFEHSGKRQDGYTFGDLRFVNVDTNGVLSATYSNGVTLQLFQITLHDFPSLQNMRREGGNLWSETRESGQPSTGAPGSGVFGTTRGYSLEQSNVDLSREFVNMITTQRGFQANSKNITTVDTMLEVVINMKR